MARRTGVLSVDGGKAMDKELDTFNRFDVLMERNICYIGVKNVDNNLKS